MNTIPDNQAGSRRRRRIHSDEFKARAVAICMQPGMSMAAVAMAHGVNANLLRRWVPEPEMKPPAGEGSNIAARETQAPDRKTLFLPVGLPALSAPAPCADIRTSCSAAPQWLP
jgi:transposase